MNPYQTLGVRKNASLNTITAAYRRAAVKCHPDKNPGDESALEKFKLMQLAFDVLRDPLRRKRFDETGVVDTRPTPSDGGESEAYSLIGGMLHQLIGAILNDGRDPEKEDLIALLKQNLDAGVQKVKEALKKSRKTMAKLEAVAKRFKKKKGENILAAMARAPVLDIQKQIAANEAELAKAKMAYGIVKEFEFERDTTGGNTAAAMFTFGNSPWARTGTSTM